jgi:hypothetical protein
MKKLLFFAQLISLGLFILTLLITLFQFFNDSTPLSKFNYKKPVYNQIEEFDPSLSRLNSLVNLKQYCDSLYNNTVIGDKNASKGFDKEYTDLVSSVIRKRFFHGYSSYGFDNNYVGMAISKATLNGFSSIVIPEDILKYPYAACSQQSIIMMEILKDKGLQTRKIVFKGKNFGHFCFEVFYNGGWHFYDPNMEPDVKVLNAYDRPGIAFLANHPDILTRTYKQYPREEILDIFPNYSYGGINEFPAPRGIVFQKATKFLSYTIWLFFLIAFIAIRRKYIRYSSKKYVWNSRIYFPQPQAGTSSSYYPGITAPGA